MKLGIIGGSSQVGSSVAYYLKNYTKFEVICFIRSGNSKVFFDLLNIKTEYLDLNNKSEIKEKLKDCLTVIDFTLPAGELYSISQSIHNILSNIISNLHEGQIYIYMSSIMAYGMSPSEKWVKSHSIPRSSYAYIKRKAESKCLQLGKKHKVKTYNYRLGQVHGFLQSVNTSFREKLQQNDIAFIDGNETDLTNTVFINSIAEAIIKFSKGNETSGTYTLVSNPQWSLKELYNYYIAYYNIPVILQCIPVQNTKSRSSISANILSRLKKYRPLLETYVLMKLPSLSLKVKGKYRENGITQMRNNSQNITYIDLNLLGKPDGQIINNINSGYCDVFDLERDMESVYLQLIEANRI